MQVQRKFAKALDGATAANAFAIASEVTKEIKNSKKAKSLCALLSELSESVDPNWVHVMLNKFIDPFIVLFGEGGIQWCCLLSKKLKIFQHLCNNWIPIAADVKQHGFHSTLYQTLSQQKPEGKKKQRKKDFFFVTQLFGIFI